MHSVSKIEPQFQSLSFSLAPPPHPPNPPTPFFLTFSAPPSLLLCLSLSHTAVTTPGRAGEANSTCPVSTSRVPMSPNSISVASRPLPPPAVRVEVLVSTETYYYYSVKRLSMLNTCSTCPRGGATTAAWRWRSVVYKFSKVSALVC
jgi:hypothetical protein